MESDAEYKSEDDDLSELGSDHAKSEGEEASSDDEHNWKMQVKEQFKKIQKEKRDKEKAERYLANKNSNSANYQQIKQPKFFELKEGMEFYSSANKNPNEIIKNENMKKLPLASRLKHESRNNRNDRDEETLVFKNDTFGNKQMTFVSKKVSNLRILLFLFAFN